MTTGAILSLLSALLGAAQYLLLGRKLRMGWVVVALNHGLVLNYLNLVLGVTNTWPLIGANLFLSIIAIRNRINWNKKCQK